MSEHFFFFSELVEFILTSCSVNFTATRCSGSTTALPQQGRTGSGLSVLSWSCHCPQPSHLLAAMLLSVSGQPGAIHSFEAVRKWLLLFKGVADAFLSDLIEFYLVV